MLNSIVRFFFFASFVFLIHFNLFAKVNAKVNNYSERKQKLQQQLNAIPKTNIQDIKSLFHHLFYFQEISFTLFGDKPVSFCQPEFVNTYAQLEGYQNIYSYCQSILKPSKSYREEWLTWEKYKHIFEIKKFVLVRESLGVLLLNKENVKDTVIKNGDIFNSIIKNFNVDKFIENVEKRKGIFDLLASNHELFGILLGFGKYNSYLFQRREDLDPQDFPLNLKIKVPPSPGYASIQSELKDLSQKLCHFNE